MASLDERIPGRVHSRSQQDQEGELKGHYFVRREGCEG